jgi:hypothetical protein
VDGKPYLERYLLLRLPNGGMVWLHRFLSSDPDRGFHNHPWDSVSLMLVGGYDEIRLKSMVPVVHKVRPGQLNFILNETFHRVQLADDDAWSMFTRMGTQHRWGFLRPSHGLSVSGIKRSRPDENGREWWNYAEAEEDSDDPAAWEHYPKGRESNRESLFR